MKVPLLNKSLTSERVYGIRLPFPPLAIPVDSAGRVCKPEDAQKTQYSTIVLLADENFSPAVFEFSSEIYSGLSAYAQRHVGLHSVEVLLSRDATDGRIRMRLGKTGDDEDVKILATSYQEMYDMLYDKYISNIGRKLHDFN